MPTAQDVFPKIGGDPLYYSEVNQFAIWNYFLPVGMSNTTVHASGIQISRAASAGTSTSTSIIPIVTGQFLEFAGGLSNDSTVVSGTIGFQDLYFLAKGGSNYIVGSGNNLRFIGIGSPWESNTIFRIELNAGSTVFKVNGTVIGSPLGTRSPNLFNMSSSSDGVSNGATAALYFTNLGNIKVGPL